MSVDFNKLSAPMPREAVEWRVQSGGKGSNGLWARLVPYADSRWLMSRLDEVVGPGNWRDEYESFPGKGIVLCKLSIRVDGEWVTKQDVGDPSNVAAEKGAVTDAFKRACVKWNVGNARALYDAGECWADIKPRGRLKASVKVDGRHERFSYDPPSINLARKTPIASVPSTTEPEPEPAPKAEPKAQRQAKPDARTKHDEAEEAIDLANAIVEMADAGEGNTVAEVGAPLRAYIETVAEGFTERGQAILRAVARGKMNRAQGRPEDAQMGAEQRDALAAGTKLALEHHGEILFPDTGGLGSPAGLPLEGGGAARDAHLGANEVHR